MIKGFLFAFSIGANLAGVIGESNLDNNHAINASRNTLEQISFNIDQIDQIDQNKISNQNQLPNSIHQQFLDLYKNKGKSIPNSNPSNKPIGVLKEKESTIYPPKEKKILLGDYTFTELEIDGSNTEEIVSYCDDTALKADGTGMNGLCTWWRVLIKDWLYAKDTGAREGMKFVLGTVSNIDETAESKESLTMALICAPENAKYYANGHAIITKGLRKNFQYSHMPLNDASEFDRWSSDFIRKSKDYLFNKLTTQAGCPFQYWEPIRQPHIKTWLKM